jgi:hypothetical protein
MVLTLNSYREAAFDQGALLKARFPLKVKAQEGVCYALVIEFYRKMALAHGAGESPSPDDIVKHLEATLGTSINRQAMHDDGLTEAKRAGGGVYDFVKLFNAMGRVSGIQWAFKGSTGTQLSEFGPALNAEGEGMFMLRVEFASGGGHAIAVAQVGGGMIVFDPNFGIFESANPTALAAGLWAQYDSLGMKINNWWIISVVPSGGVGIGQLGKA